MTNIVVIVIDTLRYDHVGANGNPWIQTPNLDRLAARSWVFDHHYAASYPTIPFRLDAMTGRYGGPFHPWTPLPFDAPTFPRALAEMGYATQLIHDTPHLVNGGHNFDWPFNACLSLRGAEADRPWVNDKLDWLANWKRDPIFDAVGEPQDLRERPTFATYARANRNRRANDDWSAAQVFNAAADFVRDNSQQERFFLWVDCFDPHEPWEAPPEFMRLYDDTPGYDGSIDPRIFTTHHASCAEPVAKRIKAAYAAKTTWMDHCLGRLLDALDDSGLAESTALMVVGDHGTNLGEWGVFGKTWPVREFEARTPLFIHAPGAGAGRSDAIVQPQDFFATVMGLAGGEVPGEIESFDALAAARASGPGARDIALTGTAANAWAADPGKLFSVFDGDWCLVVTATAEGDVLTLPGTQENVAAEHPDVAARLRQAGVAEIERRGAAPAVMAWLRSGGTTTIPDDCPLWDGWPGPPGFEQYWVRLFDWEK